MEPDTCRPQKMFDLVSALLEHSKGGGKIQF